MTHTPDDIASIERTSWAVSLGVSVLLVGAITAASRGAIPRGLIPPAPVWLLTVIPHVNALLISCGLATLAAGYRAIRRGNSSRHATLMQATLALFLSFLLLYLLRLANQGLTEFTGPAIILTHVYRPLLFAHIALAILAIPLVCYAAIIGIRLGNSEIQRTNHPRVGRVAAPLLGASFLSGMLVYLLLHHVY